MTLYYVFVFSIRWKKSNLLNFSDIKATRFGETGELATLRALENKSKFYAKDSKSIVLRFMSVWVAIVYHIFKIEMILIYICLKILFSI